ncbi:class I SAM-dependent RNA methyltransferase [uncultured Tateyamaria sp.]|uniref:class I SAM-dependent RNA methyltransferase n=1 Tax=uncultured Tateyamaria sp. TaxID=455651 RepID=UPI00262E6952|nr:class I SAM-dependent RNA methyltransferase [uncultured Tateyamaria sp.]
MTTVTIDRLGQQGDGVARGPLFVPLALPGEVVSGTVDGDALTDVTIDTPSPERVSAPCPHFRSCGGCQLQHASDDLVASWKRELVVTALSVHGLETDVRPTLTSPDRSRRRATFAARRTKKGAMVGFHARKSDAIIPVPNCILVTPTLSSIGPLAEALAMAGASRKGALAVTATDSREGLDISVTGGKPLDGPLRIVLAALCETHRLARLTWEDELIGMRVPPAQSIGAARVVPPPGAFLQATEHGQDTLTRLVQEIVGKAKSVVDLFAGCGTFALPLAQRAEVLAVEGAPEMVAALDAGWRQAQGLKRIESVARDLFRRPLLPDELAPYEAAVIDPPRAGAAAQIAELAAAQTPIIAHVSCNPQTFARDAATLISAGYVLEWVQPVDQFRWAAHVELVGAFRLSHTR